MRIEALHSARRLYGGVQFVPQLDATGRVADLVPHFYPGTKSKNAAKWNPPPQVRLPRFSFIGEYGDARSGQRIDFAMAVAGEPPDFL